MARGKFGRWGHRVLLVGLVAVGLLSVALFAACGSETTTVIREAPAPPAETIERTTTVEAAPAGPPGDEASAPKREPPNVLGLPLPAAERLLKSAGYKTAAKNTDTTFGIIVRENYSICRQGNPRGDLVVVLAQKYGC